MAPASFNLVMIISIFGLTAYFNSIGIETIYALGVGVLVGGATQFFVQLPMLLRNGFALSKKIRLLSPQVRRIIARLGIGTVGIAATQINLLINTFLATSAGVGAVSFLSFGMRLFQFPVGILGVSISGANLVYFSEKWKSGEKEQAKTILQSSYYLSLFVMFPALIFLYIYAREIVYIIFERGSFDKVAGDNTALALKYYLVGLPSYGLYKIFGPTFYAIDREKLPIFISIFCILVNVVFCVALTPKYGFKVLALGTSISMIFNTFLQMVFINREINLGASFFFPKKIIKLIFANLLTAYILWLAKGVFSVNTESAFSIVLYLSFSLVAFTLFYLALVSFLVDKEIVNSFLKKLWKRKIYKDN